MVVCDRQRDRRSRIEERLLVQSGLYNGLPTFLGERLQRLSPPAGGFQPRRAVVSFQPQDPEARALALFGMPVAGPTVSAHWISRERDHARYHARALVEALDGGRREPDVQGPVHQGGRDAGVVALDLDMRIDSHPRGAPLRLDIGLGGERLEGGPVHRLELGLPTAGEFLEGAAIQPVQAGGDRRVELRQTEEGVLCRRPARIHRSPAGCPLRPSPCRRVCGRGPG